MRWIQPRNYLDNMCQEMVTYVTKVNISLEFAEISVPDHDSASCLDAYRIHACAFRYLVRCACYDRRTCDHRGERFGQKNTLPLVQGLLPFGLSTSSVTTYGFATTTFTCFGFGVSSRNPFFFELGGRWKYQCRQGDCQTCEAVFSAYCSGIAPLATVTRYGGLSEFNFRMPQNEQ